MQLLVGSGVVARNNPFSCSLRANLAKGRAAGGRAKEGVPWTEGLGTRGKAPHDPCLLRLWAYVHADAGGASG